MQDESQGITGKNRRLQAGGFPDFLDVLYGKFSKADVTVQADYLAGIGIRIAFDGDFTEGGTGNGFGPELFGNQNCEFAETAVCLDMAVGRKIDAAGEVQNQFSEAELGSTLLQQGQLYQMLFLPERDRAFEAAVLGAEVVPAATDLVIAENKGIGFPFSAKRVRQKPQTEEQKENGHQILFPGQEPSGLQMVQKKITAEQGTGQLEEGKSLPQSGQTQYQ